MSLHFRGPLVLKQFAVYAPSTSLSKKRSVRQTLHDRRHGHQQFHGHNKEVRDVENHAEEAKRGVGSLVTATMANGAVITFPNAHRSAVATTTPTTTSTATVVPATSSKAASSSAAAASEQMGSVTPVAASSTSSSSAAAASVYASSGSWTRQAYYSSNNGTADGLVFLNNMGGGASGVFNMYAGLPIGLSSRASHCANS